MKMLIAAITLLLLSGNVGATEINFTWTANAVEENITGYRIYLDGGFPANLIVTVNDPLAESASYVLTENEEGKFHVFSITAFREATAAYPIELESGHGDFAIYAPPYKIISQPESFDQSSLNFKLR